MAADPNAVEQAVSRTLRDNLEKIQRTADELHQAVNDMVAACASSRASNALPSMIRAQTSAASLAATLEVLSRFVTGALQPAMRMPFEPEILRVPSLGVPPVPSFEQPPPLPVHPKEEVSWTEPAPVVPAPAVSVPVVRAPAVPEILPPVEPEPIPAAPEIYPPVEASTFSDIHPPTESSPALEAAVWNDAAPGSLSEPEPDFELELPIETHLEAEAPAPVEPVEAAPVFNLDLLPPDEQELHRRAFRVAKVSMQDIRMLRPEDVRLGRENKDLCFRLRDDIEKAHKEYDRRFQSIQSHPVDYFYDWMVEILGGGDPKALGEYPYPSPVLRR
jgi:uncharacterized damage-inducible protein DinB